MTNWFKPGRNIIKFPKNTPKNWKYKCIKDFKKNFRNWQEVFILVTEFDPISRKFWIEIKNNLTENYKNNLIKSYFLKKSDLDFYFKFIWEITNGEQEKN